VANPLTRPPDVCNRALDECGVPVIAEMYEGSASSRVALRHYGPSVRSLLRSAHWNFARKTAPLSLAKDTTNTDGTVPTDVPPPWLYEYLDPEDCIKVRFVPQLSAPDPLTPPLMTNLPVAPIYSSTLPAPFVVGTDLFAGPDGTGIAVILTNVKNAMAVYTAMISDPQQWDPLFMDAVVAFLAARFAMPLVPDKKLAMQMRAENIAIVKDAVGRARVSDGNEGWSTVDHIPDFIRVRSTGGWPSGFFTSNIPGLIAGWDTLSLPDGSAY
jgi:hypothetical protein